ncbi:hypothetical protein NKI25_22660 [Mesorhizobium sp. M0808]|uniref:hypothetical protein n=1 Tax=Mesorhizobium sp. M0808 TaxID=2957002 RepID=UPI0033356222
MTGVEKTKTAVITGAGGDTGQAISREFVAGGRVVAATSSDRCPSLLLEETEATSKHDKEIASARHKAVIRKRFEQMSEIATEIRHVTKPGANLFAELGFSENEAKLYHGESRKHIEELLS